MDSLDVFEKNMYGCPEVDTVDLNTNPLVNEQLLAVMENGFLERSSYVCVYPYVRTDNSGKHFIDIYIWDCMLYPCDYARFVIRSGYTLSDGELLLYLRYAAEKNLMISDSDNARFTADVKKFFPHWNYPGYVPESIGDALKYLFYVSHDGYREKFYKAGLINIAKNIDQIPAINVIGNSPVDIIGHGATMKLLRILDTANLTTRLYDEDTIKFCVAVYRKYCSYLERDLPTAMQWAYLEALYLHGGRFWGGMFNRKIYRRIRNGSYPFTFGYYNEFFGLRDVLFEIGRIDMSDPYELPAVVERMREILQYVQKEPRLNARISQRKAHESNFEYSDDHYAVILPKNCWEICKESIRQRNCVLDYLEPHASKQTTILFVREENKRQDSYVTMEIDRQGTITQVFARYNILPGRSVFEFLEEYAYRKGFFMI